MNTIDITKYSKVVILTGAGISAGSGIKTYRGVGARFNELDVMEHSSAPLCQDSCRPC